MNPTFALFAVLLASEPGRDLSGTVVDSAGKPIPKASVLIYTARPRSGTSPLCPSCYPDCAKRATTDDEGCFSIESLDPKLIFRVLAVADGFRAQIADGVDPRESGLKITLPVIPEEVPPDRMLRGRVVDRNGEPIVGAMVEPFGAKTAEKRWWGTLPSVDPIAVTDGEGTFVITAEKPALAYDLKVSSRNHATRNLALVETGAEVHLISLDEGAQVVGWIMDDGKPVSGAVVGLVQTDRSAGHFVGQYEIATDERGHFEFLHVHPGEQYCLYTRMGHTGGRGSLKQSLIQVGGDRRFLNVGKLTLSPAYKVSGRITLSDGKPIPEGTRLLVGREQAWDSQVLLVEADGTFTAEGVPREPITFSIRVSGYRLSSRHNRLQQTRPGSLALFVEESMEGIEIVLEPIRPGRE